MARINPALLLVLCTLAPDPAGAQSVTLPSDAEYRGALLKGGERTFLAPNGRVIEGVLKADYSRGPFLFGANTIVRFDSAGNLVSGVLKQDVAINRFVFRPGSISFYSNGQVSSGLIRSGGADRNFTAPTDGSINFTQNGVVTVFTPTASTAYRLFDRSLMFASTLHFNEATQSYSVSKASSGLPQIVARTILRRDDNATPTQAEPVILPAATAFTFHAEDGIPSDAYATWFPSSFTLGGINFGPTPQVWVRDFKVVFVQIARDLVVGPVTYRAGTRVVLDDAGRPLPPAS